MLPLMFLKAMALGLYLQVDAIYKMVFESLEVIYFSSMLLIPVQGY